MKAAKAAGAVTSFDLNLRAKLWKISGGADRAVETLGRIVDHVDVLVGNEEDLQKGLGVAGPAVEGDLKARQVAFVGMMDNVVEKHPNVKIVATTLREVHSYRGTPGARWRGSMATFTPRRTANLMFTTAWAAATDLRRASFMGC